MDKLLKKLSKKTKLSPEFIKGIWAIEHSRSQFAKEQKLVDVDLIMDANSSKLLAQIAKELRVSMSAVVQQALVEQMKQGLMKANENMLIDESSVKAGQTYLRKRV